MSENENGLSFGEYDEVGQAIFASISAFEGFPDDTKIKYHPPDNIGDIGLYTMAGGKYLTQDIVGGFTAQLPFNIAYKCAPTANYQYMEIESMMNELASWLEKKPYPVLTGGREVTKITMNSTTYIAKSEDDGATVYIRSGNLIYEK